MSGRVLIGTEAKILAVGTATVDGETPSAALDFGTPNDLNMVNVANFEHGERLLLVLSAVSDGNDDAVSFAVLDAPDSNGSIGTPAAATTDGDLAGGTGTQHTVAGVELKDGRPWLRVTVATDGETDTFTAQAVLLALPGVL